MIEKLMSRSPTTISPRFSNVGSRKEPLRVRKISLFRLVCRAQGSRGHLRSKTVHGPEGYDGLRANDCTNSIVLEPRRQARRATYKLHTVFPEVSIMRILIVSLPASLVNLKESTSVARNLRISFPALTRFGSDASACLISHIHVFCSVTKHGVYTKCLCGRIICLRQRFSCPQSSHSTHIFATCIPRYSLSPT